MKRILLALTVFTAALGVDVQPAAAEPRPYCLQGGRGSTGGMLDCSYHTWEQCLASRGGGGDGCSINPALERRAYERARAKTMPRAPAQRDRY